MVASNNFSRVCLQLAVFSVILSCAFSAAIPIHKHRRHLNRRLFLNSYGNTLNSRSTTNNNNLMEGSVIRSGRDSNMMRNKPLSINFLNSGFMMRPDKTSQFRSADNTRFYRINAVNALSQQGGIRTSPFADTSFGVTMKKILLRMN